MFSTSLFAGTLRVWRTPFVWWPVGIGAYLLVTGWLIAEVARSVNVVELMSALPTPFVELFSGSGARPDLATGRYGGFIFYLNGDFLGIGLIYGALYAMFLAPGLVAGDWERGTLDVLLARPLTRRAFVVTRFAAYALVTALVGAAVFVAHAVVVGAFAGFGVPWRGLAGATFAWTLVALAFGAIAFLMAAVRLSVGAGSAAVLVVLVAMVALQFAGVAYEAARPLADLSFYKYWRPLDMLFTETAEVGSFLLYGGVAICALAVATIVFERRDLA